MKISDIISYLESIADPSLQEHYDNAGLITGDKDWECTGIICSLDAIESVIEEAIAKNANMVVAHHPIIFSGLKKINGKNYVEKTIIRAIKNDIAIYAIHTNIDNVINGVSGKMAEKIGLINCKILSPKEQGLRKLFTFVPLEHAPKVRTALFEAGGGEIGNYSDCSFNVEGMGTFKAGKGTDPFVGKQGEQHQEKETRIEMVYPAWIENKLILALKSSHPYEEVAYDIVNLTNLYHGIGAGILGELPSPMGENEFLEKLGKSFGLKVIRHTALLGKQVKKVALCGGAGSFLISKALALGADIYITGDIKYHEFFDANQRMVIADIGHYESEQFTINLLHEVLARKFPTFAILKTEVDTNPASYLVIKEN